MPGIDPQFTTSANREAVQMARLEFHHSWIHWIKNLFLFLPMIALATGCQTIPKWEPYEGAPASLYPSKNWPKTSQPELLGWSSPKLADAKAYADTIDTAAVMIVDDGVVVDAWGDIARKFQCHSMRKSLMSALIGVQVDRGEMDLARTLDELGIDDTPPTLTPEEKQATVGNLIKARSGIYHPALGESPGMKAMRPKRGSHHPGSFWYYNNWDFNALGTIYEQETGTGVFDAFERDIAKPVGMEDFDPKDCRYLSSDNYGTPNVSRHRYYLFRMSARDLARFGLLFLRDGRWKDHQVVSQAWVQESTSAHSKVGLNSWYGYLWWSGTREGLYPGVQVKGHCYSAAGWGGHRVIVLPFRKLVVVHRVNTDWRFNRVSSSQIGRLLWHILDAAGEKDIGEKPVLGAAKGVRLTGDTLKQTLVGCTIQTGKYTVKFPSDSRIEFWIGRKRIDTARWGVDGNKGWLKGKVMTGGKKVYLYFVLEDDILKWYDRDGTLDGKGRYFSGT
jgi:CubicO group peptidase (beta-lactamase class C family)